MRYDNRDTGRSTAYPPGSPGYGGADMVADAVAVLDELQIDRAHVVGLSMGGGIAQHLAVDHRDRVATLTLISTTSAGPGKEGLPGMTAQLQTALIDESPEPDWNDRDAVVDYIVKGERPFAGPDDFDEPRMRALAERVYDRSNDIAASLANHWLLDAGEPVHPDLSELRGLPTLVLHGTADRFSRLITAGLWRTRSPVHGSSSSTASATSSRRHAPGTSSSPRSSSTPASHSPRSAAGRSSQWLGDDR